ncbi:LOW QUALITY PROTEIN: LysM domain-containing protein/MatE domain-containing protein [Cephalotus follicularis]|uniref:Protein DETOXIFICATION n=1 Tax=Cephalotus follicularis TaxID=3775 RepID=A0A1Q3AWI0_CEPFO|nr:LOW QUALITY PROTEIN: LysM domain-containing protein/MatE domain-containing protein [Cephalotus follicularis]
MVISFCRFTSLLLLLTTLLLLSSLTTAQPFKCTVNSTCHALVGYKLPNTTSLSSIQTLFGIKKFKSLLGANNLPISTPQNQTMNATQTIKVPIPCFCVNGTGVSNKVPVYTVQKDDGLYHIAAEIFSGLLLYQTIADHNNISNVNDIALGQNLWIPLPCSCDDVDGEEVVHYAHVVEAGSSLEVIESEFGTPTQTVMSVNGIANDSQLIAGAVLDIPLKACSSSIRSDSEDSPLLVSNDTYVLTANQCVKCQCMAANNWTLQCEPSLLNPLPVSNWSTCPSMQCEGLNILSVGNTTLNGCNSTTCAYAGYSANRTIFTTLDTVSTCLSKNALLGYADGALNCHLSAEHRNVLSPLVVCRGRSCLPVLYNQLSSDCGLEPADVEEKRLVLKEENFVEERLVLEEANALNSTKEENPDLKGKPVSELQPPDVKRELIKLSLPALAGQAIDPLAQLMETAYIGRLGHVELASAGVSISIFNIISKLFNIPLLSVATSFVAEDISKNAVENSAAGDVSLEDKTNGKPHDEVTEKKQLSSVSTALLLAVGIGIFECVALFCGSGPFINLMGVPLVKMYAPAKLFLALRALGAPAVVVSLALQGIFRGFKDTQTPVLCIGNFSAVALFPLLMNYCGMGVTGAAVSVVVSQYIVALLMLWHLNKKVVLLPPKMGSLQFGCYIKSGGFLIGRTLAVLLTMTLGTSMAARQGPVAMAAHQICMQVWLAVSLLTDALAASGQALIASYLSKGDFSTLKEVTNFVLKIGLFTGLSLAAILGVSFKSLATLFTKDAAVLGIVRTGVLVAYLCSVILSFFNLFFVLHVEWVLLIYLLRVHLKLLQFVSASQPINSLAFIFDGLHYGVSDFQYAAYSMMLVGAISSAFFLLVPSIMGLPGVWLGLTLFMGLRMAAGYYRILSNSGPWWFLHKDFQRAEVAYSNIKKN